MDSECEFCNDEFEDAWVKNYEFWNLQLHTNQYYLGRCIVKLNRHAVDITEMSQKERQELFTIIVPEVKEALDELFGPDFYNYASLGNSSRHLHFHIIPRYSSKREFAGRTFKDENWDSHWKPDYDTDISQEVLQEIIETLSKHLN